VLEPNGACTQAELDQTKKVASHLSGPHSAVAYGLGGNEIGRRGMCPARGEVKNKGCVGVRQQLESFCADQHTVAQHISIFSM